MKEKITFGTTNVIPKRILVNSQSLTITFESNMEYQEVKTMLSNTNNTKVITYTRESEGKEPYTLDYNGYTCLKPITVGDGEYTVTLDKPSLEQQLASLQAENELLRNNLQQQNEIIQEQQEVNEQQDMCIVELLQQIYS